MSINAYQTLATNVADSNSKGCWTHNVGTGEVCEASVTRRRCRYQPVVTWLLMLSCTAMLGGGVALYYTTNNSSFLSVSFFGGLGLAFLSLLIGGFCFEMGCRKVCCYMFCCCGDDGDET